MLRTMPMFADAHISSLGYLCLHWISLSSLPVNSTRIFLEEIMEMGFVLIQKSIRIH